VSSSGPSDSKDAQAVASADDPQQAGRLPTFVIVGAMKSGTTSIRAYLDAHPEAFSPPETHYFTRNYDKGIDWYRERFAEAAGARVVGDKTPNYMYSDAAVERMAAMIPDANLIVILRNPIDRAYSHYWHHRRVEIETRSFEEAIESELAGTIPEEGQAYLDYGRYLRHLERLYRFYPKEKVLVLLFEDLEARPAETFAETCRFLGIDDTVIPSIVGQRTNTFRTYRGRRLYKALFRRKMWRLVRLVNRFVVREASYPPMSPVIRARLHDVFAEDNLALARSLGRDLSIWDA
jgi:sulfotransferase family protein